MLPDWPLWIGDIIRIRHCRLGWIIGRVWAIESGWLTLRVYDCQRRFRPGQTVAVRCGLIREVVAVDVGRVA